VLGRTETALSALSDPVAIQADGTPLPVLTSVVDDLDAGVTDIVRGADHIAQSAAQLDIHAALGGPVPRLAHVPQLRAAGDATRFEALTLRRLRGDGVEPVAMAAYLAELGSGRPAQPRPLADLAAEFDLAARAGPAVFDVGALQALNRRLLGSAPFSEVSGRLPPGVTETFWLAVRGSIDLLGEVRGWWDVVAGSIVPPVIEGEAAFLRAALAWLPAEPWGADIWPSWLRALREATGRGQDAAAQLLRLALTGEEHGPDLGALLPLIGRARAAQRLQLAAA
jgi:glutamyl-tRNA synthetase